MKIIFQAFMILVVFTGITGVLYPALVTAIAQIMWAEKSNGSLIKEGQRIRGSLLIGQPIKGDRYFWPRPSSSGYLTVPASASNLGPTSKILKEAVIARRLSFANRHEVKESLVPIDLITTSASGLDPHISLPAGRIQIERISRARGFKDAERSKLINLMNQHVEAPQWGIFGEPRINVLALNIALDVAFGESR